MKKKTWRHGGLKWGGKAWKKSLHEEVVKKAEEKRKEAWKKACQEMKY